MGVFIGCPVVSTSVLLERRDVPRTRGPPRLTCTIGCRTTCGDARRGTPRGRDVRHATCTSEEQSVTSTEPTTDDGLAPEDVAVETIDTPTAASVQAAPASSE